MKLVFSTPPNVVMQPAHSGPPVSHQKTTESPYCEPGGHNLTRKPSPHSESAVRAAIASVPCRCTAWLPGRT